MSGQGIACSQSKVRKLSTQASIATIISSDREALLTRFFRVFNFTLNFPRNRAILKVESKFLKKRKTK